MYITYTNSAVRSGRLFDDILNEVHKKFAQIYTYFFLMEGGPKICPTSDDFII